MRVSGNLWIVVKNVKPLVVYDVECEMAMDSIKRKCASSWVDLRYTNLFCIPEVTLLFFSCCDSVLGDSLQFHQGIEVPYVFDWERGTPQDEMQGNPASSRGERKVSCVFSSCGRNLGYILELQMGCPFETGVCSVNQDTFLGMRDTHECKLGMAGQYGRFWKLSGVQVYFSIWHSDIGITNYIKKLSGIVNIWSTGLYVAFELSKAC